MKVKKIGLIFLIIIISINITGKIFAQNLNVDIGENEEIFKDISAPNVVLAETNTNRILYEKNTEEKIYPASITKLMTAILVVENCELDDIVTVSEKSVMSVPTGYVNANLQVGEQLTVEDLLYAMLIPSANDAANALAEHTAGSIESFSSMMNTRAKELGCTGSNFTNPSGLHEETHYTTVKDLLFIAKASISNSTIKKIIGTTTYTLPITNKYTKEDRIFSTTNYLKKKSLSKYYCNYCIGGKTGYTEYANNCVVEFAEKNDIKLIAIVMGENSQIKGKKFLEAKEMFDYVYSNYEKKIILKKDNEYEKIKIQNGTKKTKNLGVIIKDEIKILENKNVKIEDIKYDVEYTNIKAPITKGQIIGNLKCIYKGVEYKTDLIACSDVEKSQMLGNVFKVLIIIVIIYIIYNYKKSNKKYKKHGKNTRAKRIYYN